METLPHNAALIADDDVWIDGNAVAQLRGVANADGCIRAVGMPDLHGGATTPIGAVFAFTHASPPLIGGDIGCGVRLTVTGAKMPSLDKLERRLRHQFDEPAMPWASPEKMFDNAWTHGASGFNEPDEHGHNEHGLEDSAFFGAQLGTIGGGNHFAEVTRVSAIYDEGAAEQLGMKRGSVCSLVHSGSRALGKYLASRFPDRKLAPSDHQRWLAALTGGRNYAEANRAAITERVLTALGATRRVTSVTDLVHNDVHFVDTEAGGHWVHRKGAAPANAGEVTVVFGSRGTPSYVLMGTGAEAGLSSVAHGAGRRMKRGEALRKLKHTYTRKSALHGSSSTRLIANKPNTRFEEHPDAYKAIGPVVRSLVNAGLATMVAELQPRATVKT